MPSRHCILILILLFGSVFCSYSQKNFSAKRIEAKMVRVSDTLYAHKFETSNGEYNTFLNEIHAKDSFLWARCRPDTSQWQKLFSLNGLIGPGFTRQADFSEYPAVSMRYAGAVEYCKWLTEKYNSDPKRKFKKVLFTLPTKKEWMDAANGGRPDRMYPWGNYYLVRKKGYFMCNFKPVGDPYYVRDSLGEPMIVNYPGQARIQAAEFPEEKVFNIMKVKSFEPNLMGLYNVCGNAAEMINLEGWTMGGSWNSFGSEITPRSSREYNFPSVEVGFRVFMKIIEQ